MRQSRRKSEVLRVRLTQGQLNAVRREARTVGLSASAWVRMVLIQQLGL